MPDLDFREATVADLRCLRFSFDHSGERVPGVAWTAQSVDGPAPLVLIQHPGAASKDDYFVRQPAMEWARAGWICAGLDAPFHGERATPDPLGALRDRSRLPAMIDQFSGEVTRAIDLLSGALPIDTARIGFVGYSMGSLLGLPAVARDGRFKAAAFCQAGAGWLPAASLEPGGDIDRLANVAVCLVGKSEDELIPAQSARDLFDRLGGIRELTWLPGGHFEIGPDVIDAAGDWLRRHL